mmetsp:Transcript_45616/g.132783  ORF Transcript_45616/g.132783 Transcript_45616/m.132783 type:complete len:493 (+) Transcript_45616:101-1579(+)
MPVTSSGRAWRRSRVPELAKSLTLLSCAIVAAEPSLVDVNYMVCGGLPVEIPFTVASSEDAYVVSFWRTTLSAVTLTLKLVQTSNPANLIIPETTLTLDSHAARRLEVVVPTWKRPARWQSKAKLVLVSTTPAVSVSDGTCEEVFLFDGRDPVDLPDTWRAARADFGQLCEAELGSPGGCAARTARLFSGLPADDSPFQPEDALCQELAAFVREEIFGGEAIGAARRRLKSASGGTLAHSYTPRSQAASDGAGPSYGFSTTAISTAYPRGYTQVGYGYTGRNIFLGAVAGSFVARTWYVQGYSGSRVYTKSANSSSPGQPAPVNGGTMVWNTTEEFVRDDIMEYGFYPDEVDETGTATRFTLHISSVEGADLSPERICPPASWSSESPAGWTAPRAQDLFVDLTLVSSEEVPVALIVGIVLGSIFGTCCLCCCVFFMCGRLKRRSGQALVMVSPNEPVQGAVVMGSPAAGTRWPDDPRDPLPPAPVRQKDTE